MGFFKDIYGLLGPGSHPASLGIPCAVCEKRLDWKEMMPADESTLKVEECRKTCEYATYFDRYGINRKHEISDSELCYLVEWIEKIMIKWRAGTAISILEFDQLHVWGDRLSLVLAMEEAKIAAATSALESAREVTG